MEHLNESKRYHDEFVKGIWKENPVFIAVLGLCPALAVSNTAINSLAMAAATMFVLICSSILVSIFRNVIPKEVRITSFVIIIATFVTVADFTLQAFVPKIHKDLGAFIALIVVNCLILGRQEAFAFKNNVKLAAVDALGMSLGFGFALFCLGAIREILGNGSLFDVHLFGPHFEPWVIMILPPGGFLSLGFLLLFFNWFKVRQQQVKAKQEHIEQFNPIISLNSKG
ncbi:MAG: electron transport complex subunit E [SAR324 cluster bacterium]|nr:electron transport complex subunit E [SAR324 cluster bacterium]